MKRNILMALCAAIGLSTLGCNIQDVPPAHKGWEFEEGIISSSDGFINGVLESGSHSLDLSSSLYLVQCSEGTEGYLQPALEDLENFDKLEG